MRQSTSGIRTACAVLALAFVACVGGCYGMPRIGGSKGDAGGVGGATGSNSADAGDAGTDTDPTGCPATCPGPTTGPTTGSGACIHDECRVSCSSTFPTLCIESNACVDLTSDSKNCGACGHDCLGGACVTGQCQSVLIAQYIGNPQIIYVGAQAVYVTTDSGYVGRASKDGSDLKPFARPDFASSAFNGTSLAEDGERLFLVWNSGGTIQVSYCMTSGCDSTAKPIGGPYTQYFALDRVNHKIVWVDYSPSRFMGASTVETASGFDLPGGTLPSGFNGSRLLYSQGGIYFADGNGVSRIPGAGGAIAGIAGGTAPLAIIGANKTFLFVYDGTAIASVPLPNGDGGKPKALIVSALTSAIAGGRFAADDGSMYWASGGQANTCKISNCAGTQRALPKRPVDSIYDIGIDDAAVFLFAQSGAINGTTPVCTVWRLAK